MHLHEDVLAVSITEAARRLSISPRTLANLVAHKTIRSRKVGRRRLIPMSALTEFLEPAHKDVSRPVDKALNRG
jgi:excisionase family DNA binding protein